MSAVSFKPFQARDLDSLEVQAVHALTLKAVRLRPFSVLDAELSLWSFTMWVDGKPRACCGIGANGGIWAFLAPDMKRTMLPLWRYGRAMIDAHVAIVGPVWASVDPEYPEAVHLVRMAKFWSTGTRVWMYP